MLPVLKRIRAKARRLAPIIVACGLLTGGVVLATATPASAASCGDTLLAGSSWLGGNGVNVYSNAQGGASYGDNNCGGTDDYVNGADAGGEWQCVELVNRLYLTEGWITTHWSGNGSSLVDNIGSHPGLTKQDNGSITSIVPGDVVTLNYSTYGHAGIVASVTPISGSSNYTVTIANQNAPNVWGTATWSPSARTLSSEYSGYTTQAVVHAAANTATDSGGSVGGGSSDLYQFYVVNGNWTAFDVSAATGGVSVTGTPAVDPNGGGDYAVRTNHHLYQFYVADGAWTAFDISAATGVQVQGTPAVDDGIYARGTDNHLYQFYVGSGGWTAFDISAATGVSLSASPAYDSTYGLWGVGINGHLYQYYVGSDGWTAFDVSAASGLVDAGVGVTGTPAIDGGTYALGTNSHLYQFYVYDGAWTYFDVTAATGVELEAGPAFSNTYGLWGVGINGHLYQLYVGSDGWTYADVSGATGVNVQGTPAIDGGTYAQGTDGDLYQFYVSNGAWTAFNVSGATGDPISGNPVLVNGGLWGI